MHIQLLKTAAGKFICYLVLFCHAFLSPLAAVDVDKLTKKLRDYLASDELNDFPSIVVFVGISASIDTEVRELFLEFPEENRPLVRRLCVAYLRTSAIDIFQLFALKVPYRAELAILENNIKIRTKDRFMEALMAIRNRVIHEYLAQRSKEFGRCDEKMQSLLVRLFLPEERNKTVDELLAFQFATLRLQLSGPVDTDQRRIRARISQGHLIAQFVKASLPLAKDGRISQE